ncbi:MAG TPA: ATP-binding protein [Terriglobales bacterium]
MQDWGDTSNWIARFAGWTAPSVRSRWNRYGTSLAFTVVVLLLRGWLNPLLHDRLPYFLLYAAVFFSSWYAGLRPAIFVFLAGGFVASYLWVTPFRDLHSGSIADWMELITYVIVSVFIIGLGEAYRRALDSARGEGQKLHRSEEQLRSSQTRLRMTQQATRSGTWEWKITTNTYYWSPEYYSLLGLKDWIEPTYQNWLGAMHSEDRDRVHLAIRNALEGGEESMEVDYRIVENDSHARWIRSRGSILRDDEGTPILMLGVSMDITERKQSESLLIQTEKLVSAGRMAATIAHEINNPLESVTNLVFLANNNLTDPNTAASFLRMAEQELARMSHLTRQTLGFYRETSAPHKLKVSELLNELHALYAPKLKKKDIRFELFVRSEIEISAVGGEVRQVFGNLISNSIDAVEPNGEIIIVASVGKNWQGPPMPGMRITVVDNGPGIPPQIRKKIFEPFFTTKKDVGTGLGLWVSRNLIEKHGGAVHLHSRTTPGRSYTAFSIFLPVIPVSAAQRQASNATAASRRRAG